MSMRDLIGEESEVEGQPKVELSVGEEVVCTSGHCSPSASTAISPLDFAGRNSSLLLRIFSSKEIVPKVLEYEKAILVMKEHDYAKKPDRAEIVQLSSLLQGFTASPEEENTTALNRTDPVSIVLNLRKEIQEFRESLAMSEDGLVTSQLRDLVSMHIELIREQQEQLHDKDKELSTVRKDKEQLEARLERMERRLAISQRRAQSRYENSELDSTPPRHLHQQQTQQTLNGAELTGQVATPKLRSQSDVVASSDRQPRSRSSSNDRGTRSSRRISSHSGTPAPQDIPAELHPPPASNTPVPPTSAKRSSKRKIPNDVKPENTPKKKKARQTELRTKVEYSSLNLPLYRPAKRMTLEYASQSSMSSEENNSSRLNHTDVGVAEGDPLGSQSVSSCSASVQGSETGQSVANGVEEVIAVPSWRTCNNKTREAVDSEDIEDLSDEIFLRRHKKPEEDEKRRKRWDMQRARDLRNYEELKRKYEMKSGEKPEKKKERMLTFVPKFSEVATIEIRDTVAVSAFGMPLPVVKPKEFALPWVDLDTKESKEHSKTPSRSRTKSGHRTSVSSLAEEELK